MIEQIFENLTGIGEFGGTLVMGTVSFYVLSLIIFLFLLVLYKKKSTFGLKKALIILSFTFYLVMLIRIVFFPIDVYPNTEIRHLSAYSLLGRNWTIWEIMRIDFVPFRVIYNTLPRSNDLFDWYLSIRGIIGNLILLFPFGVFLGLIAQNSRNIKQIVLLGILISSSIEIGQLSINLLTQWPNRLVALDDIMLNTIGFLLGALLIKKYNLRINRIIDSVVKWVKI